LRFWQLRSAYDETTQLFYHGAPATIALIALTLLAIVVFVVLCWGGQRPKEFMAAFRCPNSTYLTINTAAAFLFVAAGVLGLLEGAQQWTLSRTSAEATQMGYPIAVLVCAILCIPSGASILLLGKDAHQGQLSNKSILLSTFPAFAGVAWVFSVHLNHGTDPILMRYAFSLFAAVLLTLAHYLKAGFIYGHSHPHLTAICALSGSMLAIISLADGLGLFGSLVAAAFALSALAQVYPLLHHLFDAPWPEERLTQAPENPKN
jgi:magnesium-transporting ATPase (P-type)